MVKGIVSGSIVWEPDPDFGYSIAATVPGIDDAELLQPRRLYERQGRLDEYERIIAALKQERRSYVAGFPGLAPEVAAAI